MKKSFTMVLSLLFYIFFFSACHKDIPNTPASEYFPNKVGNYLEYDVYDSSIFRDHPDYPREYTVKLKVTGIKKLIDGKDATVWQYEYPWGKELNYVRLVGDTVKVFDEAYSTTIENLDFPRMIFLPPFQVNKRWDGKLLYIDSLRVTSQGAITNLYQTFSDCYQLYHYYQGPNLEYKDDYWFKPNIGMVKIHYHQDGQLATTIQTWQLRKYVLK